MIDLRSDTVTRPTPEMRQAMADASVGDAVLGDDPTVLALQERVADLLGTEAALYLPSGTMANEVALRAHTEPGDEILCAAGSHIDLYEAGAPAALAGCRMTLLACERGIFSGGQLAGALHVSGEQNPHYCTQKLVVIENTHNCGGGAVWPPEQIAAVELVARDAGLRMHMDGARLWNACAVSGVTEREYARHFDSVSVCFSKGLGAPVGSALAGSGQFIRRCGRFAKQFGGGMRQAGIIAAGALYALEHHRDRLGDDHANARRLAERLDAMDGVEVDLATVQTNMVYFDVTVMSAAELCRRLNDRQVGMLPLGPNRVRAVTHMDVTSDQIDRAVEILTGVLATDATP